MFVVLIKLPIVLLASSTVPTIESITFWSKPLSFRALTNASDLLPSTNLVKSPSNINSFISLRNPSFSFLVSDLSNTDCICGNALLKLVSNFLISSVALFTSADLKPSITFWEPKTSLVIAPSGVNACANLPKNLSSL